MPARGVPVRFLQRVPLFVGLTTPQFRMVARLFKKRHYDQGEVVINEGSGGAAFFVIESGEASVTVRGRKKATLKSFDYFGELALIDGGPRMETITATTKLVCYAINYWDFRPFVIANGVIGWKLLQGLAQMVRDVGEG
jgi:CRP/FNR family cyclic AMP-dependent transcriptional regulator